jgi:hypothetical protein
LVTTSTPEPSGRPEVDEREVELHRRHQRQRIGDARALGDLRIGEDLQHQLAQPGPDLGQVFEQKDVLHGVAGPQQFMLSAYRPRFRRPRGRGRVEA